MWCCQFSHMNSGRVLCCALCEARASGSAEPLADESEMALLKAGECCHLTTCVAGLPGSVYLRAHPEKRSLGYKPYRMYCKACRNQLGVMVRAKGCLIPSFQSDSVVFRTNNHEIVHAIDWKCQYADSTYVADVVPLGEARALGRTEPLFYVLDPTSWRAAVKQPIRVRQDQSADSMDALAWQPCEGGYVVTGKLPVTALNLHTKTIPRAYLTTKKRTVAE